jgi:hypothetical protein
MEMSLEQIGEMFVPASVSTPFLEVLEEAERVQYGHMTLLGLLQFQRLQVMPEEALTSTLVVLRQLTDVQVFVELLQYFADVIAMASAQ